MWYNGSLAEGGIIFFAKGTIIFVAEGSISPPGTPEVKSGESEGFPTSKNSYKELLEPWWYGTLRHSVGLCYSCLVYKVCLVACLRCCHHQVVGCSSSRLLQQLPRNSSVNLCFVLSLEAINGRVTAQRALVASPQCSGSKRLESVLYRASPLNLCSRLARSPPKSLTCRKYY